MADIQTILGVDNLVGVMQSVRSGLPRVLPVEYYNVNRSVEGDMIGFDDDSADRKTMPVTGRDAPAREFVVGGISQKYARALTIKGRLRLKPTDLENIRAPGGSTRERRGLSEVKRKVSKANDRIENTRLVASHMMLLGGGVIYYDNDGNLLPDGTGAINSVNAGIPAGNLNQLGGIIAAVWSAAGTDIIGQMRALHTAAQVASGYPLTKAAYGKNILGYLVGNTAISNILNSHSTLAAAFTNMEIPSGFLGIQSWLPAAGAFWVDKDGTTRYFLGDNDIAFLPDADGTWLENVEGTFPVPNGDGVFSSLTDATSSFIDVQGKFAYAWIEKDPPSASGVFGDTYLPMIKVPAAVYKATVAGF